VLSATLHERLDLVGDTLGSRAALLRSSMGERADAVCIQVDASISRAGKHLAEGARAAQTALADLRLPELPARFQHRHSGDGSPGYTLPMCAAVLPGHAIVSRKALSSSASML